MTEWLGFIGALIAVSAYFPQIVHLIKEHCTAGLSRPAFSLWFLASLLITIHALNIHAVVFITLGVAQMICIAIILYYCSRYNGQYCLAHLPQNRK